MDVYRTPQETTALRDVAYVISFGHFPGEEEEVEDGITAQPTVIPSTLCISEGRNSDTTKKNSNDTKFQTSGCEGNPFGEDDDSSNNEVKIPKDKNYSEGLNPFSDDGNPFSEDFTAPEGDTSQLQDTTTPVTEDNNPFSDDCNSTSEDHDASAQQSQTTPKPSASSSTVQQSPATSFRPYLMAPHQHVDMTKVSKKMVKDVVTELFNVTQLDLRCLIEEVSKHREKAAVQLQLEDLRTEGLGLQPTTDPSGGISAGGIAGIVIAVLFVVAAAGIVGYSYMQKQPKGAKDPERQHHSFDNVMYEEGKNTSTTGGSVRVSGVSSGTEA